TFGANGYDPQTITVPVSPGQTSTVNVTLNLLSGTLVGTITDAATGAPIAGADVTLSNSGFSSAISSLVDGTYTFSGITPGTYSVRVSKSGYISATVAVLNLVGGETTRQDVSLVAIDPNLARVTVLVTDSMRRGINGATVTVSYNDGTS